MHVVKLKLDVRKPPSGGVPIRIYQGDTEAVLLRVEVTDGGEPYQINGTQARFEAIKPDDTWVSELAAAKSPNMIEYVLPPQLAAAEGLIDNAYFRLLRDDTTDSVGPVTIEILPSIESAGAGESSSYCPALDELMDEMRQLIVDGGAKDYAALVGKPSIEGRTLDGDVKLSDLGITKGSNKGIEAMFNEAYRRKA